MAITNLTSWILLKNSAPSANGLFIANDLAGSDAPKLKFVFSVEIGFRDNFGAIAGSSNLEKIEYDLKSASRPNITPNQEDVNFYGYRTKITNRINYGSLKLTFYEDSLNNSNDLLWKYINYISPISRTENKMISTAGDTVIATSTPVGIGPLGNSKEDGPIAYIKLFHYYMKGENRYATIYTYSNPKLESAEMDDLDMSSSDPSTITVSFSVDAINVQHSQM